MQKKIPFIPPMQASPHAFIITKVYYKNMGQVYLLASTDTPLRDRTSTRPLKTCKNILILRTENILGKNKGIHAQRKNNNKCYAIFSPFMKGFLFHQKPY